MNFLKNNKIWIILFAALFLRVVFIVFFREPWVLPGIDYDGQVPIANALIHNFFDVLRGDFIKVFFAPAFPFFIALVLLIFHSAQYLTVFHLALGLLTIFLIYKTALLIADKKTALISASLYTLYLPVITSNLGFIDNFTLFVFCLAAGMYFFMKGLASNRFGDFGLGGLFFGLAALTKPLALFIPVPLLVFLILSYRYRTKKMFVGFLIFLVGFGGIIFPWAIRNYAVSRLYHEKFRFVSKGAEKSVVNLGIFKEIKLPDSFANGSILLKRIFWAYAIPAEFGYVYHYNGIVERPSYKKQIASFFKHPSDIRPILSLLVRPRAYWLGYFFAIHLVIMGLFVLALFDRRVYSSRTRQRHATSPRGFVRDSSRLLAVLLPIIFITLSSVTYINRCQNCYAVYTSYVFPFITIISGYSLAGVISRRRIYDETES